MKEDKLIFEAGVLFHVLKLNSPFVKKDFMLEQTSQQIGKNYLYNI